MRGKSSQEISECESPRSTTPPSLTLRALRDDVERAIKNLKCLGSGFNLIFAGSCRLVQSVPLELSTDHTALITLAGESRCVSVSQIQKELGWGDSRARSALVRRPLDWWRR